MNNVSIGSIKKSLEEISKFFDPTKSTYSVIKSCIGDEMTAEEMLMQLLKIGNTNNYPIELQDFFYNRFEELKLLAEKDREILVYFQEIEKKNKQLDIEFKKRNIVYNGDFVTNFDYLNMTYNEKKEYIFKCKEEIKKLDNQLEALSFEKQSGESFNEKMNTDNQVKDEFVLKNNEETKRIQEESKKNIIYFNNPSVRDVLNYINDYRNNSQDDSRLNVKIEYQNDSSVRLNIGYKGVEVNEKYPMIECNFSDVNLFNKEIYPVLLEEHVIDGGIKGYNVENNNLTSENLNEEGLQIEGNSYMIGEAGRYLDNQKALINKDVYKLENKNVRVRKLQKPYNSNAAIANGMVVVISLMFMIALVLFVVAFIS